MAAVIWGLNEESNGEIYVYNAHGDTVQLVKNNAVLVSYTYDAFGNLTSQAGESDNPFLYGSEYFDSETQTYYLRARYYNPANGRFTQQDAWAFMDASDPLSLNLYTYCCNNPILYVDPSGRLGGVTASLLGLTLLGSLFLSSCDNATSKNYSHLNEKNIDLNELYYEFYNPDGAQYDNGSFNKEETVFRAAELIYNKSFNSFSGNRYEYGAFIYSNVAFNPETEEMQTRYYVSEVYTSRMSDSVYFEPERVPDGATIEAFMHSHPFPKDSNVFSYKDIKNIDMYVVEECMCIYVLRAGDEDYTTYEIVYRVEKEHEKLAR